MLYEELLNFYLGICESHIQSEKDYNDSVEKKWYSIIPSISAKIELYKKITKDLKLILANNFKSEIIKDISIAEIEYIKQQELSKSMWENYGSELAGDYNESEVLIHKKLIQLKKILE